MLQASSEKIFSDAGSTPIIRPGYAAEESDATSIALREAEATSGHRREPEGVGGAARMDPEEMQYRERMRKVEMSVMEYREELEECGIGKGEIELKVNQYREKLRSDAEKADANEEAGLRTSGSSPGDKEREGFRDRDREKDKDRVRERHRLKTRDKERDRERERERERRVRNRDGETSRFSRPNQERGGLSRSRVSPPRARVEGTKRLDRHTVGKERSRSRSPMARRRRNPSASRVRH